MEMSTRLSLAVISTLVARLLFVGPFQSQLPGPCAQGPVPGHSKGQDSGQSLLRPADTVVQPRPTLPMCSLMSPCPGAARAASAGSHGLGVPSFANVTNGHCCPSNSATGRVRSLPQLLEAESRIRLSDLRADLMGLHLSKYLLAYLGEPRASLPPQAEEHRSPQPGSGRRRLAPEPCQASLVQGKHWTWVRHFPATPPRRDYAQSPRAKVPVACGNLPRRLRPASLQGVSLYHARMSCRHRWLWQNRSSPVTVRISATPRPESLYKRAVTPERPDPCARETVLKALSQCNKGRRKFDGPLWFETPEPKKRKQSPARTPSAFKPVPRNGVVRAFVPKPGKLKRSVRSLGTECARKRAAGSCSSAAPRPALQAASARNSSDKEPRSLRQGGPPGQERTQPAAPGGC